MLGKCEICQTSIEDKTKNHNRKICGSQYCVRTRMKSYMKTTDPIKRKESISRFRKANPEYLKKWREENRERDKELNREYIKNRYHSDILYRLAHVLRTRLYASVKKNKKSHSKDYLGCTVEELKKYLELKFESGMTWDNYGDWHIDHIVPLALASSEEELYKLCCYSNLQPLWALDNLKKGCKNVI